jgi:ABC-type glycerol-3-phosphate transport system substrate-binding protein
MVGSRRIRMTRARITAVGALLSLAVAAAVFAQTQTQAGSFFQITTVTVKASGALDYEEYLKKSAAAREKLAIQTPSVSTASGWAERDTRTKL